MKALLIIWLAAHGCDTVTTHMALSRGGMERNPIYTQSPVVNDALMAGEGAALALVTRRYGPSHPKLAKVLLVGGIAVSGYAAAHNLHTLQVQSR